MSTYWRLLEIGEKLQEGDEYLCDKDGTWVASTSIGCPVRSVNYRRRVSAGWIPISERKPEPPCVLGFYGEHGWAFYCFSFTHPHPSHYTHWCPLPEPPQSDDEKAFEAWFKSLGNEHHAKSNYRDAYFAGLAEGRKQ